MTEVYTVLALFGSGLYWCYLYSTDICAPKIPQFLLAFLISLCAFAITLLTGIFTGSLSISFNDPDNGIFGFLSRGISYELYLIFIIAGLTGIVPMISMITLLQQNIRTIVLTNALLLQPAMFHLCRIGIFSI